MRELDLADLARIAIGLRNALTVVQLRSAQLQRAGAAAQPHHETLDAVIRSTQVTWMALERVLEAMDGERSCAAPFV